MTEHVPQETWRQVVGFEGLYEISDRGLVQSVRRRIIRSDGRPKTVGGVVLRAHPGEFGHLGLQLWRGNKYTNARVHQLVLAAFVGPCPDGLVGCHNDGNPANNTLSNLRWDTLSSNNDDAVIHGTHHMAKKTHCKWGHEFTPENSYQTPGRRRQRICRQCASRRSRERYAAAA